MQKMSLEEYARRNPVQEESPRDRQEMQQIATEYKERQQEIADAQRLKESLSLQLQQGNEPRYILYTALELISALTRDDEWIEAGKAYLNSIYEGLEQECLHIDTAAVATFRLKRMKVDYNERLKKQLARDLTGYNKIKTKLEEALEAIAAVDDFEFWEEKKLMEPIEKELKK